jgi:hypothetical protein
MSTLWSGKRGIMDRRIGNSTRRARGGNRFEQRGGILCAGNGDFPVENEERHALDADVERFPAFAPDFLLECIAFQHGERVVLGPTAFRGYARQLAALADATAFEEEGLEEPLDERRRVTLLLRPSNVFGCCSIRSRRSAIPAASPAPWTRW